MVPTAKGRPDPLGATLQGEGANFALVSQNAEEIHLCFLQPKTRRILEEIRLDPKENRTGNVWHIFVEKLSLPLLYAYRLSGPEGPFHFFQPHLLVTDPYAKVLDAPRDWEKPPASYRPFGSLQKMEPFDWEGVKSPRIPLGKLMIYEMHVRGFTRDPSSRVAHPGSFLGLVEKIPYLLDLGVNAIELLPIHEFNEHEYHHHNPFTGEELVNYWGYSSLFFFSPMGRYVVGNEPSAAIHEFKTMVREMHRHGIEVILDVVFNHTGERKNKTRALSMMGIDRSTYYLLGEKGEDTNYTGCGNTINTNHPVVRKMIRDALRYWVVEMHVDGFRFDLASIMNRGRKGEVLEPSPLIESLTEDPTLADTKLIAEPWDSAGLYQLGGFSPEKSRWIEWNGKFRDDIRAFIKGDHRSKNAFATRMAGSKDIFPYRTPLASLQFVTAHDGFSLADLVAYQEKHNEANGENNRDGTNHNISWNCGQEGETENIEIVALRLRQRKNFLVALFFSQGIPMLVMGDEYGHSRKGNNNPWCQDNPLNWFSWEWEGRKEHFFQFVKGLIRLRRGFPVFQQETFFNDEVLAWHGRVPHQPEWENEEPLLAWTLLDHETKKHLYIAFNATWQEQTLQLPPLEEGMRWHGVIDTYAPYPEDCVVDGREEPLGERVLIQRYSSLVACAR